MPPLPRAVALACLGAWLGAAAFFSFAVAPSAFRVLGREQAGRLVGAVFPAYYAAGMALAVVTLVAWWAERKLVAGMPRAQLRLALVLALNVLLFVSAFLVHPAAREAKAALAAAETPELVSRFGRLHGVSVALNLAALLVALAALLVTL